jgi:hypothetical protein
MQRHLIGHRQCSSSRRGKKCRCHSRTSRPAEPAGGPGAASTHASAFDRIGAGRSLGDIDPAGPVLRVTRISGARLVSYVECWRCVVGPEAAEHCRSGLIVTKPLPLRPLIRGLKCPHRRRRCSIFGLLANGREPSIPSSPSTFGVRRSDCRRHFPCPAELDSITPHAMPFFS